MDLNGHETSSHSWKDPARGLAAAIPALVDQLVAGKPGQVHADVLAVVERALFVRVLELTRGNQLRAARLLGMNRNTLRKSCRRLDLLPLPRPPGRRAATSTAGS